MEPTGDADWLAKRFEEQRTRLRAVAYRMLGSAPDADDAVQNAWLRLHQADTAAIENFSGWLTTVVARECLKVLRTRRSQPEEPLEAEHLGTGEADSAQPEVEVLMADSVGPALMIVLDTLAPAERLAFVLHDIFAVPFEEIAAIVERSPAATRQLASRARKRVQGATPPRQVDLARQREIVQAFLGALREGDFDGLLAVLDPDVVYRDDSAPVSAAALIRGARDVATHALRYSAGARFVEPALVDGAAGLVIVPHGQLIGALAFGFDNDKIAAIEGISDPERFRHVDLAPRGT